MFNAKIYTIFKSTNREFTGTLKEIAIHFNINYNTLKDRLKRYNFSIEDAINFSYENYKTYTVFKGTDKEFSGNYKEIAKYFNINYNTFMNRIKKVSLDDAVNYSGKRERKTYTVFKGTDKEFTGNLIEIAYYYNINYNSLLSKIKKRNITIEEAILIPLNKINQNNLIYKDKKGSMKELCKMYNKNYIEVYNKVKFNHTFEWAMDSTKKPYEEE